MPSPARPSSRRRRKYQGMLARNKSRVCATTLRGADNIVVAQHAWGYRRRPSVEAMWRRVHPAAPEGSGVPPPTRTGRETSPVLPAETTLPLVQHTPRSEGGIHAKSHGIAVHATTSPYAAHARSSRTGQRGDRMRGCSVTRFSVAPPAVAQLSALRVRSQWYSATGRA